MTVFHGGERDALAPVTPLFGAPASVERPPAWRSTWHDEDDGDDGDDLDVDDGYDACGEIEREIAERTLLKRLRTRSLSVAEARGVVSERDLRADQIEAVIEAFVGRGYLDDRALADQLVHVAVERKGQGRAVIAQTLARRGIPRDVADAVLAELPVDDAERALEFARTKARSMGALEPDVALRRLTGQLARRGYSGSVALTAARRALADEGAGGSGVRFR